MDRIIVLLEDAIDLLRLRQQLMEDNQNLIHIVNRYGDLDTEFISQNFQLNGCHAMPLSW